MPILRLLTLLLALAAAPARADGFSLGLPLACSPGIDCWIQQYPAHGGAGEGAVDYACGQESYAGHDGTDFRVRDLSSRVAVLAAAAGRVKAARDGAADRLVRNDADRAAVKGRECGNGVVIGHGGGFETQYCHLRQGSVLVRPGDTVEAGSALGEVGASGEAGFPHVHLTVRQNGKAVDPFDGGPAVGAACGIAGRPLWNADAAGALAYNDKGDLLSAGFHRGAVDLGALETGAVMPENPAKDWPALVVYMWAVNLSKGDRITVTLKGPDRVDVANSVTLDRNKAQYLLFTGKRRPPGGWPAGIYYGGVTVMNGADVLLQKQWQAQMY